MVNSTLVTCFEISIFVDALFGRFLVFEIAHHYVSSEDGDFTNALFVLVCDLNV